MAIQHAIGGAASVSSIRHNLAAQATPVPGPREAMNRAAEGERPTAPPGVRSYLLHCERSSGRYLFDALMPVGHDFGIEIDGFRPPGI